MKIRIFPLVSGIALVLTLLLTSVGFATHARADGRQEHRIASWSVQHPGMLSLIKQLARGYHKGRITRQEADAAFNLANNSSAKIDDAVLGAEADQFKQDGEYGLLLANLKTAAREGDPISIQVDYEFCATLGAAAEYGCRMSGGSDSCSWVGDEVYCNCMRGDYLGGGFCLIY